MAYKCWLNRKTRNYYHQQKGYYYNNHSMDVDDERKYSYQAPPGTEQYPPTNVRCNDQIHCTAIIQQGKGLTTVYCDQAMVLCRARDLVPFTTITCSACNRHIHPHTQFLAICNRMTYHTNGKPNIICLRCLEKDSALNVRVPKVSKGSKSRNKETWHIKQNYLRRKY